MHVYKEEGKHEELDRMCVYQDAEEQVLEYVSASIRQVSDSQIIKYVDTDSTVQRKRTFKRRLYGCQQGSTAEFSR